MKITRVETIALQDKKNGYDETVVRVHTDHGATGIGQAESPSLVVEDLLTPRIEVGADYTVAVPDRPGLGFDLSERVVGKYRVEQY